MLKLESCVVLTEQVSSRRRAVVSSAYHVTSSRVVRDAVIFTSLAEAEAYFAKEVMLVRQAP